MDVITEEEMAEFKKRVWETNKAEIIKQAEYALGSELRVGAHSDLRKLISIEVRELVRPMIEAHRPKIVARLEHVVDKTVEISMNVIEAEVVEFVTRIGEGFMEKVQSLRQDWGRSLRDKIHKRLEKALKEEPKVA